MKTSLILWAVLVVAGCGLARAADPPVCTDGDCSPPSCTNGDCSPPSCTNGDCTFDTEACCCVGPNTPGANRVCCCPSANLDEVTCRWSLVLSTGYPDNWHQTLAQETLVGKQPKSCDMLLARFCSPPDEDVCTRVKGKNICTRVMKVACKAVTQMCQYRYCGPDWFPFNDPTPDMVGCGWWDRIYPCERG